jgi:hypothetical protein
MTRDEMEDWRLKKHAKECFDLVKFKFEAVHPSSTSRLTSEVGGEKESARASRVRCAQTLLFVRVPDSLGYLDAQLCPGIANQATTRDIVRGHLDTEHMIKKRENKGEKFINRWRFKSALVLPRLFVVSNSKPPN